MSSRVSTGFLRDNASRALMLSGRLADRAGRVLHYSNSIANQTWGDVAATARRYDIITLHGTDQASRAAELKAASPTCKVLCYADFLFAGQPGVDACLLNVATARSSGWLATTNGTTEIANPSAPATAQRLVDPGKAGVAAAYVTALQTVLATGQWDGAFLDDVNAYGEAWTAVPVVQGYANIAAWVAAMSTCLTTVKASFAAKLLFGNLGPWYDAAQLDSIATVLDGCYNEFTAQFNSRGAQSAAQITREFASARTAVAAGKTYVALTPRVDDSDTQSTLYGWAVANILGEAGLMYHGSHTGGFYGTESPVILEYSYTLGSPLAAPVNTAGLLSRAFKNYTVYANTTAAGVTLPDSSTLPALSGKFVHS